MNLDEQLQNVTVIGAAGKMGSGIVLLVAQEMAKLKLKPENRDKNYRLYCIDVNESDLDGLVAYIKTQATKAAEKSTILLRDLYVDRDDLVENLDVIAQFTDDVLAPLRPGTDLAVAKDSKIIFEAITENAEIKVKVLKELKNLCAEDTNYFTNTSSIPIGILDKEADLNGRIVGYHFYNPPAVQRLLELIAGEGTLPELVEMGEELAKRLRKKVFRANDIAGFIGNGHFSRDGLHAIVEAQKLADEFSLTGGLYMMNKVSQDLLVRPMGIFQLIDYVGVDVYYSLVNVINQHIEGEDLQSDLINNLYDSKVLGGQNPDGSQKDGILKYEKGRPAGVYDLEAGEYKLFDKEGWTGELDKKLGTYPSNFKPWRALLMDPGKDEHLKAFFKLLTDSDTLGAQLAMKYLKRSKYIGEKIVADGVANSPDDVNGVLVNGFYHLYGPINEYV